MRQCLRSIAEHPPTGCSMHVHVVDNASHDGTAEMVAREFPEVSLTVNATERRLQRARTTWRFAPSSAPYRRRAQPRHDGRRMARWTGCSSVMDCKARCRDRAAPASSSRRRASTTPRSAPSQPRSARSPTSPASGGGPVRAARWLPIPRARGRRAGPVDAVNGAFMLIRRAALDEVGLFDEGYWMYMEDLDLCYRFDEQAGSPGTSPRRPSSTSRRGRSGPRRVTRASTAPSTTGCTASTASTTPRTAYHCFNGLVYAGIGLKLAFSLAGNAVRRLVTRCIR